MWSIGIYTGDSPFQLHAPPQRHNPVLTRDAVSDIPAEFVADPFLVRGDGVWYMFFEVINRESGKGEIALAVSENCFDWRYQQRVLVEPFHLSYPYVFKWRDDYYMIPESLKGGAVRLYRALSFPASWSYVGPLFSGEWADPSIFASLRSGGCCLCASLMNTIRCGFTTRTICSGLVPASGEPNH